MAKFIIKNTATGCKFDLEIDNEVVCSSEVYKSTQSCKNGVESVQKNAVLNKVEDLTVDSTEKISFPKFQVFKDKSNGFRFRLCASNGQIVASSNLSYKTKNECLNVIKKIVDQAKKADII